eukprot:g4363.t1
MSTGPTRVSLFPSDNAQRRLEITSNIRLRKPSVSGAELEMANIWARSGQFAQTSRRRVGANVLTEPKCYFASNDLVLFCTLRHFEQYRVVNNSINDAQKKILSR